MDAAWSVGCCRAMEWADGKGLHDWEIASLVFFPWCDAEYSIDEYDDRMESFQIQKSKLILEWARACKITLPIVDDLHFRSAWFKCEAKEVILSPKGDQLQRGARHITIWIYELFHHNSPTIQAGDFCLHETHRWWSWFNTKMAFIFLLLEMLEHCQKSFE